MDFAGSSVSDLTKAGNYSDTVFATTYQGDGSDASTPARSKLDYTSMWMNNVSSNTTLLPSPFATNSNNNYGINASYNQQVYSFAVRQKGYVKNLVKEKGYSMARFVIMTDKHSGTISINCKWSSDSI